MSLLDVPGLLISTAYAPYQLHALNREGRELSATTLREVMHSRESVNKHGEATQPADMLAYCFRRFISGETERLNASSIGNKSTIENTDSKSSSEQLDEMRPWLRLKPRVRVATWLILPVVIRSSQRLSHACVSIRYFIETADGSLYQL